MRLRINETGDGMEIVVVSDTVRQRRSRTPQSSSAPTTPTAIQNLPDLLPKTFCLAETSSLFSRINDPSPIGAITDATANADGQQFSVVEIRESNLMSLSKAINTTVGDGASDDRPIRAPRMGAIVNSVNVLESADYFEPECVETVNIIDLTSETSDTETCCSTPTLDERPYSSEMVSNVDDSSDESAEYETGEFLSDNLTVATRKVSFGGHGMPFGKDRDILKDSENEIPVKPARKRLTPTLKEILSGGTERNCFTAPDRGACEEPLIFSDDEDDANCAQTLSPSSCTVFINADQNQIKSIPNICSPTLPLYLRRRSLRRIIRILCVVVPLMCARSPTEPKTISEDCRFVSTRRSADEF